MKRLSSLAKSINSHCEALESHQRKTVEEAYMVGQLLVQAKEACIEQGLLFEPWVEANLTVKVRQARRYMALVRPERSYDRSVTNDDSNDAYLPETIENLPKAEARWVQRETPEQGEIVEIGDKESVALSGHIRRLYRFSEEHELQALVQGLTPRARGALIEPLRMVIAWLKDVEEEISSDTPYKPSKPIRVK